jgi:hypothetical protein
VRALFILVVGQGEVLRYCMCCDVVVGRIQSGCDDHGLALLLSARRCRFFSCLWRECRERGEGEGDSKI